MRTLAIDLGTRRIGLALSDEGGRFATPYDVIQADSPKVAVESILKIIQSEGVERIVVGLPLNMDDTLGKAARTAIVWGRDLTAKSGKPVLFIDERLSSFAAEQDLVDRKRAGEKMTRGKKKQRLDALAAAKFLQAMLDGKLRAVPLEEIESR
jgi:putative Holliday junction resolvase